MPALEFLLGMVPRATQLRVVALDETTGGRFELHSSEAARSAHLARPAAGAAAGAAAAAAAAGDSEAKQATAATLPSVYLEERQTLPLTLGALLEPLRAACLLNPTLAHSMFVHTFASLWAQLDETERDELSRAMATLLVQDYQQRQRPTLPNVVHTLVESAARCVPPVALPPQVLHVVAVRFRCWHASLSLLEAQFDAGNDQAGDSLLDL